MKVYQKAANAIRWINELPDGKQAPKGYRGMLGNSSNGFCPLGYGCHVLGIDFMSNDGTSDDLNQLTGLSNEYGSFIKGKSFYKENSLSKVNDHTNAGLKRIARLMRTKPHWMFDADVADLIQAYYERV